MMTQEAFVDGVDKDQTAQMISDLHNGHFSF